MTAPTPVEPRSQLRVVVTPQLPPDTVARVEDDEGPVRHDESQLERVRAQYDRLVARYLPDGGARAPVGLDVTHDGVTERVVLDASLWQQLFEMYVYHGWDPIARVVVGVRDLFRGAVPAGSGWAQGRPFLDATVALLGGLVRDALEELEQACATQMVADASVSAVAVDRAWAHYGLRHTTVVHHRPVYEGVVVDEEEDVFTFGDEMAAMRLHAALTEAVADRTVYEAELQRVADIRAAVQRLRAIAGRARGRGRPLSSEAQLTRELDVAEDRAKALEQHASALYTSMLGVVAEHSPLGLLALEGLSTGFTITDLETLLGGTLWRLRPRLERLGAAVRPDRSKVRTVLPGAAVADATARRAQEPQLVVPPEGPERAVIDAAMAGLGEDAGWFPLLHEATLARLAEGDLIRPDSWLSVVSTRYLATLGRVLAERRLADEGSAKFWSAFSAGASAASLALLVLPPTAEVGAVVRLAAGVADLVLLAHTVTSVTGQLARLDELQDRQVLAPDAFSVEGMGRLGELGVHGRDLLAGLTQQVLIELVLVAAGARWPAVKEALVLRGYLQDVETLLAETPA